MNPGDLTTVSGCFTKEKFIAGRSLRDIEKTLGFHAGRFSKGITVAALLELPNSDDFELAAYTNRPAHLGVAVSGLDIRKLKQEAKATWSTAGFERLVKVLPVTVHDHKVDPAFQYPPGQGAPQWIATRPLKARIVGVFSDYPNGRYLPVQA